MLIEDQQSVARSVVCHDVAQAELVGNDVSIPSPSLARAKRLVGSQGPSLSSQDRLQSVSE
eukprot:8165202-Heterocapsa_arctica.AAC.1